MNGKEIVSRFLEAEAKQDVQGMADVLTENIVFEMPFACRAYLTALKEKVPWLNF